MKNAAHGADGPRSVADGRNVAAKHQAAPEAGARRPLSRRGDDGLSSEAESRWSEQRRHRLDGMVER